MQNFRIDVFIYLFTNDKGRLAPLTCLGRSYLPRVQTSFIQLMRTSTEGDFVHFRVSAQEDIAGTDVSLTMTHFFVKMYSGYTRSRLNTHLFSMAYGRALVTA